MIVFCLLLYNISCVFSQDSSRIELKAKISVLVELTDYSILDSNNCLIEDYLSSIKTTQIRNSEVPNMVLVQLIYTCDNCISIDSCRFLFAYSESHKISFRLKGYVKNDLDEFINFLSFQGTVYSIRQSRLGFITKRRVIRNVNFRHVYLKRLYRERKNQIPCYNKMRVTYY